MRLNIKTINSNGFLDKAGTAVSWVCAIHCLAMPFVLSFLPLLGFSFLAHKGLEYGFIAVSITIASMSLLPGFFKFHRNINTLLLFITGIGFVVFSDPLFEESFVGKIIFVVIGAGFITIAHYLNRRLCRACNHCTETGGHSLT